MITDFPLSRGVRFLAKRGIIMVIFVQIRGFFAHFYIEFCKFLLEFSAIRELCGARRDWSTWAQGTILLMVT